MALVNETLAELSPKLYGVSLACEPACGVAEGGRILSLSDATQIEFYLVPGHHDVVVSWPLDRSARVSLEATAGGAKELHLEAPPAPTRPPPPPASVPRTVEPRPAAPPPIAHEPAQKPFGPAVFIGGAVLTVLGAAATIVSGIDAQNDPGKDAVLRDCVGQGTSCPTYQRGKSAELRTNVLLGGTIGAGVVTGVIGVFFTQWHRPVTPYVGLGDVGVYGRF
jgi:hypothetical protein